MSYEPTNWKTGDVVTSAKLNKIEGGVFEVAEAYEPTVWKTGDVVTSAKLNKIEQALADATAGSWTTVFDGSVTTEHNEQYNDNEATLQVSPTRIADTIKVTFNGQVYECTRQTGKVDYYGTDITAATVDWSTYPFSIAIVGDGWVLFTETAGTYTIKIEASESSGGSSDVNTSVVTIENNLSFQVQANVPYLDSSNMFAFRNILSANSEDELIVPIGANGAICQLVKYRDGSDISMDLISVSGEIDKVEHTLKIMGSGTITINLQSS